MRNGYFPPATQSNTLPYPTSTGYYAPALTRENPGSWLHLLYALAKHSGQSAYHLTVFFDIMLARKMCSLKSLVVQVAGQRYYPNGMRQLKGGIQAFETSQGVLPLASTYEHIWQWSLRPLESYAQATRDLVHKAGTYKECLGGGWTSTIPMVEFLGHYYADVELSSGVRYGVCRDLELTREQAQFKCCTNDR